MYTKEMIFVYACINMVGLSWLPQKQPRQRNARAASDEGAVSKPS